MSILTSFFFVKQKTAYERRISDCSSDVCSSDLRENPRRLCPGQFRIGAAARQRRRALRRYQERERGLRLQSGGALQFGARLDLAGDVQTLFERADRKSVVRDSMWQYV